jgi:hypothetical protein
MADLYAAIGQNTKRIFPTSGLGTPKITPVIVSTDGETLPSGNNVWANNDNDVDNYDITSDYQTQGDVFLAVQAIQQYCEIYEIGGSTDSSILTVMCRDSSIPYDAGTTFQNDGSTITNLQTAVRASLGGAQVLVYIGRMVDDDTDG